jgi:hypothetical protein
VEGFFPRRDDREHWHGDLEALSWHAAIPSLARIRRVGCGQEGGGVFWTMSIILFVLWTLGMISGSTEGYWVHLLLVFSMVALTLAVANRGRRLTA